MASWLTSVLLAIAWAPPLVLLHELGHAFAALALTDGELKIRMKPGFAVLLAGECTYEPDRVRRSRAEAWIAAAGPAVSLASAVALGWAALEAGAGTGRADLAGRALAVGTFCAAGHFLVSALPLRYGAGLGQPGEESDGRVVWRILTGAPPGGLARELRELGRPDRAIRPPLALALAAIVGLAALADVWLALGLIGLLALGLLLQRHGG